MRSKVRGLWIGQLPRPGAAPIRLEETRQIFVTIMKGHHVDSSTALSNCIQVIPCYTFIQLKKEMKWCYPTTIMFIWKMDIPIFHLSWNAPSVCCIRKSHCSFLLWLMAVSHHSVWVTTAIVFLHGGRIMCMMWQRKDISIHLLPFL